MSKGARQQAIENIEGFFGLGNLSAVVFLQGQ